MRGCGSARPRRRSCGAPCRRSCRARRSTTRCGRRRSCASEGIDTILTRLGENITRREEAEEVTQHYFEVLDKVAAAGLDAHVSVKPTQLGLDQDPALCREKLDRLIERTEARGNFIWIDMEGSPYVEPTLELYRYGRAKTPKIGVAIQAYLYRTEKDVEALIPLGSAIRMVKGAYLEPPDDRVSEEGGRGRELLPHVRPPAAAGCDRGGVPAAHRDARPGAGRSAAARGSGRTRCRRRRTSSRCCTGSSAGAQERLARQGERLRVLISYGEYWFPWYMRRLAERPANVWFVLKNLRG